MKEQIKLYDKGEELRQSISDNIFSPDFKSQTTYFSINDDDADDADEMDAGNLFSSSDEDTDGELENRCTS